MARFELKSHPLGVVQDHRGNVQPNEPFSLTGGPLYAAATGDTLQTDLITNADGECPGWLDPETDRGTYTLTIREKSISFDVGGGSPFEALEARLEAVENARVVADSTLEASASLALDSAPVVWKTYTLGAAAAPGVLTLTNVTPGKTVVLRIVQPAGGGKAFSLYDGEQPVTVDIGASPDEVTDVLIKCFADDDFVVTVLGSGVPAPPPEPPVNTLAPAITGVTSIGQTVTCSTGGWTGTAPITYAYQWKRGGVDISGETASTYLLAALDEGANVTCTVTATNFMGSASEGSNTIVPTATPYRDAIAVSPGLVGYWPLGEASGTVAADESGNGNDGYIGTNVILGESAVVTTEADTSMRPDPVTGSDVESYVTVSGLPVTGYPATVIVWVDLVSGSQKGAFIALSTQANSEGIAPGIGNTQLDNDGTNLVGSIDNVAWQATGQALAAGIHMIAMTSTAGQQKYYVDGALVYTGADNPIVPSGVLCIGGYFNRIADGNKLGHASLHDQVLTLSDIAALYAAGT